MNLKKAVIGMTAAAVLCTSGLAYAAIFYRHTTYYSDATYSTPVGSRVYDCRARTTNYGTITEFKIIDETFNCTL